jgi:hypothetical protein
MYESKLPFDIFFGGLFYIKRLKFTNDYFSLRASQAGEFFYYRPAGVFFTVLQRTFKLNFVRI